MQLPIYTPSKQEREDAHLYAQNVRTMLMKAGGFGLSEATLLDCRAYINLLQGKKPSSRSVAGKEWEAKYGDAPDLKSARAVKKQA